MNQHMKPHSISQAADELEEEMMHELERVMTKSTLHYLAEGEIKIDTSAAAWAKNPKAIFNMGRGSAAAADAREADAHRLFPLPLRLPCTCCRARRMRSRPGTTRRSCSPVCCTTSAW